MYCTPRFLQFLSREMKRNGTTYGHPGLKQNQKSGTIWYNSIFINIFTFKKKTNTDIACLSHLCLFFI